MSFGIKEIQFIEATPDAHKVRVNTYAIAVGVTAETMQHARRKLDEEEFGNRVIPWIGHTWHEHGRQISSSIYLIDGVVVERFIPGSIVKPPYGIRIIAEEAQEGSTLPRLKSIADKLGLPVPQDTNSGRMYYDLSNI